MGNTCFGSGPNLGYLLGEDEKDWYDSQTLEMMLCVA